MNPYETKTARDIAADIKGTAREIVGFLRASLARTFDAANTPGQQQAVMDALDDPQRELVHYVALQTVLSIVTSPATVPQKMAVLGQIQSALTTAEFPLGPGAPPANLAIFQPQADGTVAFVPPPIEEPN